MYNIFFDRNFHCMFNTYTHVLNISDLSRRLTIDHGFLYSAPVNSFTGNVKISFFFYFILITIHGCSYLICLQIYFFKFNSTSNCVLFIATISRTLYFFDCFLFLSICILFYFCILSIFFFAFSLMVSHTFVVHLAYSSFQIFLMLCISLFIILTIVINSKELYMLFRVIVLLIIL